MMMAKTMLAVNRCGLSKISGNGSQSVVNGNRIVCRSTSISWLRLWWGDWPTLYCSSVSLSLSLPQFTTPAAARPLDLGFVVSAENNGQEPNYVSASRQRSFRLAGNCEKSTRSKGNTHTHSQSSRDGIKNWVS